jgi:hypothetical protein
MANNFAKLKQMQGEETAAFRRNHPYKARNNEYEVDNDRWDSCGQVLKDIKDQEDFLSQGESTLTPEERNDTRLYQLTMLEKLLESNCKTNTGAEDTEYKTLIMQINDTLSNKDSDGTDARINKEITKIVDKLLKARLKSTPTSSRSSSPGVSRPSSPIGGRTRRRKSKSKRTRRARRR